MARCFFLPLGLLGVTLATPLPLFAELPPGAVTQSIWRRFESSEGGFSVLFPGDPQTLHQSVSLPQAMTSRVTMLYVFRQQEAILYAVAFNDFEFLDGVPLTPELIENSLNSGRDAMLKATNARLMGERSIQLGNAVGKEIRFRQGNGSIGRTRFFLIGKRLYQVMAIVDSSREPHLTKSIEGFLTSFQLRAE